MKIHVGCGRHVMDGWWNCDIQRDPRAPRDPDVLCDARSIPLPDGCANELMACHVLEHFYLWEVPAVLAEWRRLLKPGGRLILELPNIEACARNLLAKRKDQMCMWGFYGDPSHEDPYMCHRWGYTPNALKALLAAHGFDRVMTMRPQTHGGKADRDMRAEAIKS